MNYKNINAVKKIMYFVPLLILMTMTGYMSFAQSTVVNSRTRTLSKPDGSDAIVRFFGNSGDMLVYNWDSQLKTNVFTCRVAPSNPTANRYVFPVTSNSYGQIKYSVEDIVVVDMMCFFCGTITTPSVEYDIYGNPYWIYDKKGYIGQMRLNNMTNTPNGTVKYRIHEIDNTKELKRIDAIVSPHVPTDTLLGLVGTTSDGESCILLVKEDASNIFTGKMFNAANSEEVFTDIVFCEPNFAVASRFSGEHWTFGMRGGDIIDHFYNSTYSPGLFYLSQFNTSGMKDMLTNMYTTWHYDNVDIRLCHQHDIGVYLAYESFVGIPSGFPESQTTLFLMDVYATSGAQIITLQNVDSGVKDTGCFADRVYVPGRDQVALLHKNTRSYSPWKSVVQFPYLTGTPIGVVNTYAATDDETLTSLDVYNNQQVWAAGTRPSHNDSVVLFYQNAAYTTSSCYSQPNYHTAELDSIIKPDYSPSPLGTGVLAIVSKPWKMLTSQPTDITQRCHTMVPVLKDSDGDEDTETEQ